MRTGRGRLLLGVLALLLGVGGVAFLVRFVQTSEERALAGQELVDVYIVSLEVPTGTPAEQLPEFVEQRQIPNTVRAESAVTSLEELEGLITTADLVPGEQLVTGRLGSPDTRILAAGLESVPDGILEVTVNLTAQRALGGQVSPGDYVAVMASFDLFDLNPTNPTGADAGDLEVEGGPATAILLRQALVTNVQASAADTFSAVNEENGLGQTPTSELLVTLALKPDHAERLVFAQEYGKLWLTRDSDLAPDGSPDVVQLESIFFSDALDTIQAGLGGANAEPDDASTDSEPDPEPEPEPDPEPEPADDGTAGDGANNDQ